MRIISELMLFGTAIIWGMTIDAFYNVLRVLRQYIKHGKLLMGIEDFIYCLITGMVLFKLIFDINDGIIRWYILFAVALGIWLHYKTMGKLLIKVSEKVADRIKRFIGKIVKGCINLLRRITSKLLKKKVG